MLWHSLQHRTALVSTYCRDKWSALSVEWTLWYPISTKHLRKDLWARERFAFLVLNPWPHLRFCSLTGFSGSLKQSVEGFPLMVCWLVRYSCRPARPHNSPTHLCQCFNCLKRTFHRLLIYFNPLEHLYFRIFSKFQSKHSLRFQLSDLRSGRKIIFQGIEKPNSQTRLISTCRMRGQLTTCLWKQNSCQESLLEPLQEGWGNSAVRSSNALLKLGERCIAF